MQGAPDLGVIVAQSEDPEREAVIAAAQSAT
jgi:hypothetical protein